MCAPKGYKITARTDYNMPAPTGYELAANTGYTTQLLNMCKNLPYNNQIHIMCQHGL